MLYNHLLFRQLSESDMLYCHHLKDEFKEQGGTLTVIGIEEFKNMNRSKHELATKRKK